MIERVAIGEKLEIGLGELEIRRAAVSRRFSQ
jgi:hypothetical protein